MLNRLFAWTGAIILLLLTACGPKAPTDDQAFKAAESALDHAGSPQEKARIVREFLASHPDGAHVAEMVENAVSLYLEDIKKPEDAWSLIQSVETSLKDPGQLRKVRTASLPVLGKLRKGAEIEAVASDLADRALTYDEHIGLTGACLDAGLWGLALNHAQAALAFATPEAFKADNPGREFPPDRLERYVNMRKAECLTSSAWAQANLGRFDESLKNYDQARPFTVFSYVGASEPPFDLYLGKTFLMQKEYGKAVDALTPAAVFAGDPEALLAMKTSYAGLRGTEGGFDDYLEESRAKLARPVADFTLTDYQGRPHTWSDLQKGRVMLLSFWFPT